MSWLESLANHIDAVNDRIGRGVAWLCLLLVAITATVAVLRYAFSLGWVWMQDAYLWANGTMFMLGAAYTLLHDRHVRVDFLYVNFRPRTQALVNLLGSAFFLFPTLAMIAWVSFPYVRGSWRRLEGSLEAGGLPGVFLLKSVLLLFCLLLALQGISFVIRNALVFAGHRDAGTGGERDEVVL